MEQKIKEIDQAVVRLNTLINGDLKGYFILLKRHEEENANQAFSEEEMKKMGRWGYEDVN